MSVYPFIEAEKVEHRNVAKACGLLEVSRSAFYEWHHHVPSARAVADLALLERITRVHEDSRGTYGSPRVLHELRRHGMCVRRERVARIMRDHDLVGCVPRRWITTTISDPAVVGQDLLQRELRAGLGRPRPRVCG